MTAREAVNWLINLTADIGKSEHHDLWHYEQALMEIREMLEAQPEKTQLSGESATKDTTSDTIGRQDAIDALWNALYEYEDKTEKQFMESDELDVGDWIQHRGFVQNMSDIDRQTILNLPSAQPEIIRCRECKHYDGRPCGIVYWYNTADDFCSRAERRNNE